MSAGVVMAVVLVGAAVVMLTFTAPAVARVGRDRPWAERAYGCSPGVQALRVGGTLAGSTGGVMLWSEFGVVALAVAVMVMVAPQAVLARISRRRARR